eukprot:COSAG06_NODE_1145_length_10532_cov_16.966261_5_plen_129_part_00
MKRLNKGVFHTASSLISSCDAPRCCIHSPLPFAPGTPADHFTCVNFPFEMSARKRHFFEFFLCLSRACLGKLSFPYGYVSNHTGCLVSHQSYRISRGRSRGPQCQTPPCVETPFRLPAFLVFIPSLSW